jgi:hypothetical protein
MPNRSAFLPEQNTLKGDETTRSRSDLGLILQGPGRGPGTASLQNSYETTTANLAMVSRPAVKTGDHQHPVLPSSVQQALKKPRGYSLALT